MASALLQQLGQAVQLAFDWLSPNDAAPEPTPMTTLPPSQVSAKERSLSKPDAAQPGSDAVASGIGAAHSGQGAAPPSLKAAPPGLGVVPPSLVTTPPALGLLDSSAHNPNPLYQHPQATREALIGGERIAYRFKRAKRKTIGFSVSQDGLTVSAPRWVPLYEVDSALQEKAAWIAKKLAEMQAYAHKLEAAKIDWNAVLSVPVLGVMTTLQLDLPTGGSTTQRRDAAQAWLKKEARRVFTERLDHYAPLLGVQWQRLTLSNAQTRWGSATADGSIWLNWRLVHFRLDIIDYVVVHELSHLRHMDHSPQFWDTVSSIMPTYPVLRKELKQQTPPQW